MRAGGDPDVIPTSRKGPSLMAAVVRIPVEVRTRRRTETLHDVFAMVGADDALPCGTIEQTGRRDWVAANLVYGTKRGAAHDLARRALSKMCDPRAMLSAVFAVAGETPGTVSGVEG